MSSAYPSGLDALSTAHVDNAGEAIAAATVNDLADAVNKIEAELGTLPKGGSADVKARIAATETVANAAVPKSTVTTAGDLIYATGSAAVARLAIGSTGQVLGGGASAPAWAFPPGYEYTHNEFTSPVSVTAVTEATANTVATASAITLDGATPVIIEFFAPKVASPNGQHILFALYDGSSSIGLLGELDIQTTTSIVETPVILKRRLTPAAAAKTYSVRAYVTSGTGTVTAGAGGVGVSMPGYIRITKV